MPRTRVAGLLIVALFVAMGTWSAVSGVLGQTRGGVACLARDESARRGNHVGRDGPHDPHRLSTGGGG